MKKKRLDEILIEQGVVADRDDAFLKVTEGLVFVDGQKAVSPAQPVSPNSKIEFRGGFQYVGRGALKLKAALEKFKIDVSGKICADIGSATGGFTEVLLENGAKKVYAIDTARGKLDLKLREDPRVMVMEETDIRDLEILSEIADLITIDVSLIPLREILPHARRLLKDKGRVIALLKPQYETRDSKILRHGVIKDKKEREKILQDFIQWTGESEWNIIDWMESPIQGSEGNIEYFLHLEVHLEAKLPSAQIS